MIYLTTIFGYRYTVVEFLATIYLTTIFGNSNMVIEFKPKFTWPPFLVTDLELQNQRANLNYVFTINSR